MKPRKRMISALLAAALPAGTVRHHVLICPQKQLPLVQAGDTVEKGQLIGYVGSTGTAAGPTRTSNCG